MFLASYGCVLYVGEFCSSKQFYYVEAQIQLESHKSNPLKNLLSAILYVKLCFEKKYLRNVIGRKISMGIISLFFWITATHWLVRSATVINIVASLLVKCFINLLVFFSTVLRKKYIYQSIIVRWTIQNKWDNEAEESLIFTIV